MGTKAGDDGQKKRTQAAWDADTKIHLEGLRMYVTDGAHAGQFKIADGENTFSGMGDGAYFIPGAGSPGASQAYVDAADEELEDSIVTLGTDLANATIDITNANEERTKNGVWAFGTGTTDTDPGNGNITLNNADPTLATVMYVDDQDQSTAGRAVEVLTWSGYIALHTRYIRTSPGVWTPQNGVLVYRLTGLDVDAAGYTKKGIAYVSGALPEAGAIMEPQLSQLPLGTSAGTVAEGNHTHTRAALGLPNVYFATVSTNDPTPTASGEYNQLGGVPAWTSNGTVGDSILTITGAFTANKTHVSATLAEEVAGATVVLFRADADTIRLLTYDAGDTPINITVNVKVEVYP